MELRIPLLLWTAHSTNLLGYGEKLQVSWTSSAKVSVSLQTAHNPPFNSVGGENHFVNDFAASRNCNLFKFYVV
jgi:hypothetical protein